MGSVTYKSIRLHIEYPYKMTIFFTYKGLEKLVTVLWFVKRHLRRG